MKSLRYSGLLKKLRFPVVIRQVVGVSMMPTLRDGQIVIGRRQSLLKGGDIVVVRFENRDLLKRIDWIKEDKVFVIGDNPAASHDSRHFGPVPRTAIKAKIIFPRLPQLLS